MNADASAPSPARPGFRAQGGWAALLVLAVLGAYANSLRVPFVYDDLPSIPENPTIRQLWPPGPMLHPPVAGGITVAGRPVLNASFALNHAISGREPWSYHVFNVLVHAGAALLLYGIVRRTLRGGRGDREAALVVAGAWSLHPLLTQAVTYTVQRAESLMGFFLLLTLYAFVRAESGGPGRKRWLALSVLACALGMATKEVMATAPLLVLLYDRTFAAGTLAGALRRRGVYHAALAATWVIAAALFLGAGGNRGGTVGLGVGIDWWAYPLTQFLAVARYAQLAAWPSPLIFEYGTSWVKNTRDLLPHVALVLPALGLTLVALRRWPRWGFLGAWFFVILAPSSLAPGTIQMIVEHRTYLPLAALVAGVVIALRGVLGRTAARPAALALAALTALTAARNHDYRSPLALWSDTVVKRPLNPRARESLAEAHEERGDIAAAIVQRETSVRLKPDDWKYQHNFARALAAADRLSEAVEHYEISLRLNPAEPRVHHNLAIALMRQQRVPDALAHYARAVQLAPEEAQYHFHYAVALLHAGRVRDAAEHFAQALDRRADAVLATFDAVEARFGLGSALAADGQPERAAREFAAVLQTNPRHPQAHFKLGNALLDSNRVAEAIPHFRAQIALQADDAEAHHNLGVAHARLEQWAEAERAFEAALKIRPDYPDARRHLAQVHALTRR